MIPQNPLQPLLDLDRTSPQFHELLVDFLRGNEYQTSVPALQEDNLTCLVEYLDSVLAGISDPASLGFQESLHELSRVCSIKGLLPKSCALSGSYKNIDSIAFGCVCDGILDDSRVCVERVRIRATGDRQRIKETFHRVAVLWKHLGHPNIVPLLGVVVDPLQLVSTSMPGGSLMEYIVNHPTADKISLLSGIAEGLYHLHNCNIIHGNLKGSNILVNAAGLTQIADFGLATVTQDLDSIRKGLDEHGQCGRWIAPEILDGRETYSKEGDVFSFGMVTIEVFTGDIPFSNDSRREAMLAIVDGERPPRPADPVFTDKLWGVTQRCWDQDVKRRPHALRISCSFGVPAWKRLIDRPLATNKRISLIADLFSDRSEVEAIKRLSIDEAQSFVNVLDEMLDSLAPWLRRKCLSTLCRVCGHRALLPRSVQISLRYDRTDTPRYQGGFAEVWKTEYKGRDVAVKVLKVYMRSDLVKITRRFCKEVVTWKSLRHQNVLPLLGVMMIDNQLTMVSEWMANGNANEFIKAHRDANRFELLKDVARGLIYMHGQVMIHGDLKGANILIDSDGHARLADFGLLTIVSDSTNSTTASSSNSAGTTRWMSPELFDPEQFGLEDNRRTKESDCYALAMVILEVLTGQVPFPRYDGFIVVRKVVNGERPERPQGPGAAWFTDDLWEMLERCWSPNPKLRPTVEAVLECLEWSSTAWHPLPPSADDNFQPDDDHDSFSTMSHLSPNQTISQDADQPMVSSQSPPHDVNAGLGSSRSSPASCGTPALGWENTSWDRADTSRPKSPVSSTAPSRGNVSPVPIPGLSDPVLPLPITTSEAASTSEPEPTKNKATTPVLPSSPIPSRDPQHGKHQDMIQQPPVTAPYNVQYRGVFEEGSSHDYRLNNASISATDSWGGPVPYDASPEFEGYWTRGRPNGRGISDQSESSKPSHPELRPLTSLSSGPADNPLGIRPSPPRKIRIPLRSALQRGKGESKKGAAIGSSWPKNKSNGGGPPLPGYPEGDSPIAEYLPRSRPSGALNGKPPPNFVHGHTIKATIQDVSKGPTTPPRGVKRRLSPSPETPRIENWTPVHVAAVPGPNVRMGMIAFSHSGRYFAVSCSDRSVRIWDTHTYAELAKLAHVQSVVSVAWMENDSGVVSLGELGEINGWTKLPTGEWTWARMLDASGEFKPGDRPMCFAYMKDRIAVAYPQMGVKVWLWVSGIWQPQRPILARHVTNIRFVEGGKAIIGGTSDCVLWYYQVPSGKLRACNLFSAGIDYIDVSPSETEFLVSLMDNTARVVGVNESSTEVGVKLNLNAINAGVPVVHGGIYLNRGNSVLYGDTQERMFKWGMNGVVVAELMKAIGVQDQYRIEAVASYDFADGHPCAGCIVMGTASGDLLWWRYHSNGEFERPAGRYNQRYRYD